VWRCAASPRWQVNSVNRHNIQTVPKSKKQSTPSGWWQDLTGHSGGGAGCASQQIGGQCLRWVTSRRTQCEHNESALHSEADIRAAIAFRRSGPCVDGSGLARRTFTSQAWSVQPCVRPFIAVHMTAGHNALRGSGPGQQPAFDDALAQVGCPDRRNDRLCITCCSPSQPSHHAGCPA
jgi:hypothetical protein